MLERAQHRAALLKDPSPRGEPGRRKSGSSVGAAPCSVAYVGTMRSRARSSIPVNGSNIRRRQCAAISDGRYLKALEGLEPAGARSRHSMCTISALDDLGSATVRPPKIM